MAKKLKKEKIKIEQKPETDITGLINKIQDHLFSLERKIDTLLSRSPGHFQEKHFEHKRPDDRERHGGFRERNFYKAVCADCGNECELPFKPGPNRPVYCKECFSKRKSGGNLFKQKQNNPPVEKIETQEFGKKRRPLLIKRKKR